MDIGKIYKLGIASDFSNFEELMQHHVVSQGWPKTGDLSFAFCSNYPNRDMDYQLFCEKLDDFRKIIGYNEEKKWNYTLPRLLGKLKKGDIILAFVGDDLKGITQIPGDYIYFYNEDVYDYKNCLFPMQWVEWNRFCKETDPTFHKQGGQGVPGIVESGMTIINDYCKKNWNEFLKKNNISIQPEECNNRLIQLKNVFGEKAEKGKLSFINRLNMESYKTLLQNQKNLILSGAPGTGKTYLAKEIAKNMGAEVGFVQFHPSYDYTDFVEGLRPIYKKDSSEIGFERRDGVFLSFCRKALDAYKTAEDKDAAPKYVFIIDEINRGEISKIFGELFFAIDPGYRGLDDSGYPKGLISTQYNNLWGEQDAYDKDLSENDRMKFYIPDNVYIIGTMNDIDRSVESMDFAFRRRFAFKEILASKNTSMLDELENDDLKNEAICRMESLNIEIEKCPGLNSSYHIGASYFLKLKNYKEEQFEQLWKNHLKPLLREYLRGMPEVDVLAGKLEAAYNMESNIEKNEAVD